MLATGARVWYETMGRHQIVLLLLYTAKLGDLRSVVLEEEARMALFSDAPEENPHSLPPNPRRWLIIILKFFYFTPKEYKNASWLSMYSPCT